MSTAEAQVTSAGLSREEVEVFLYEEAALLDSGDYDAWFALFTPDATYWIPSGSDDIDPTRHVSVVYDDIALLSERVRRFRSGIAYAQEPQSRSAHAVSNIRIVDRDADAAGVRVHATFVVVEYRRGQQHVHAGQYRYVLVKEATGGLRIRQKKVELINNAAHLGNLSLLL